MSGTAYIRLIEVPDAGCVLPRDRALPAWHAELTAAIGQHLSPAHAFLLAEPVLVGTDVLWRAAGTQARCFADLGGPDRTALLAAAGAIFSDIRRLAESGLAPLVTAAWPALRGVTDFDCVFAVDGRPVLARWGHQPTGEIDRTFARLDDNRAWQAPPVTPWRSYAVAAATMSALCLLLVLLLPLVGGWVFPVSPCGLAPGQQALLDAQARETARSADLQAQLDALVQETGRRQLQCPISPAPAGAGHGGGTF